MSDRRHAVPFDPEYFGRLATGGQPMPPVEAFRHSYRANHWAGTQSRSGPGSGTGQTMGLRQRLPTLVGRLGISSLLDLPCGDGVWMATVPLAGIAYTGADLLTEVIDAQLARPSVPNRRYQVLDMTSALLPRADLLLCRDCWVHLSFADVGRAVANVQRSTIEYLLTTTFPDELANVDIVTGDWRPINLEAPPFSFPPPLELLNEGCTEGEGRFADKSLGLWRVDQLRAAY